MPFRSEKQRIFLMINHPDVYKKWKKKYGTKIVPKKRNSGRKGRRR